MTTISIRTSEPLRSFSRAGTLTVAAILCFGFHSGKALADEQMTPLAHSGSWIAGAHSESMVSAPDMCLAMNTNVMFAFRATTSDGTEVRVIDKSWSLPASVTGTINLSVAGTGYSYPVTSNTDTMVSATIQSTEVGALLDKIAAASTMTFQVGKAKPVSVSLDGSKTVLTAFRTCAGIGGGSGGGANPFR